jgi:hypothetical protein
LLSTISYLPHIFLYNLEVKFSKGTYSWDQEVYEAKTFLVPYRKIQYVAILIPLLHIEKYGGDKILYLTKEGLASISEKLNPFWRDILLNLSELLSIKDEQEKDIINILSQPIWLNFNIKRNGNFFYY